MVVFVFALDRDSATEMNLLERDKLAVLDQRAGGRVAHKELNRHAALDDHRHVVARVRVRRLARACACKRVQCAQNNKG
jgi:hypothetical protein